MEFKVGNFMTDHQPPAKVEAPIVETKKVDEGANPLTVMSVAHFTKAGAEVWRLAPEIHTKLTEYYKSFPYHKGFTTYIHPGTPHFPKAAIVHYGGQDYQPKALSFNEGIVNVFTVDGKVLTGKIEEMLSPELIELFKEEVFPHKDENAVLVTIK